MIDELAILRIVGIKGRVSPEAVATSLAVDAIAAEQSLADLTARELVKSTPMGFRITPAGREHCSELVAAEHKSADGAAVAAIYMDFTEFNTELKAVITDWQMSGPDEPNAHTDQVYDDAVLERLQALHEQVLPLLDRIGATAPRLARYKGRLEEASKAIATGDLGYVSKPIIDSYHTVWFELHEDLIGLAGLTRADEAEAGRGA